MRKSRGCELIHDFSIGEILDALEEFVKGKPFFTIDMKGSGKYVYIPTHKQNRLDCLRLVFGLLVYNRILTACLMMKKGIILISGYQNQQIQN